MERVSTQNSNKTELKRIRAQTPMASGEAEKIKKNVVSSKTKN